MRAATAGDAGPDDDPDTLHGTDAAAVDASLDDLLAAIELRSDGEDRFVVEPPSSGTPGRVFGGQLLAQAVVAVAATVEGKDVHSLHATFVRAGTPSRAVTLDVDRVRDGRSMATRQVRILEGDRLLMLAVASFAEDCDGPDVSVAVPQAAPPAEVPVLQDWARDAENGASWVEQPPAVEMRLPEAPSFWTGATATSDRSHWMRLRRDVGDDHARHAALLAYASDFFLMDMVLRMHPDELGPGQANGFSLDHAIWFHRPVRFDAWHLYTQHAVAIVGDRGVAGGTIHDGDGRCVATVAQEILLRPAPAS